MESSLGILCIIAFYVPRQYNTKKALGGIRDGIECSRIVRTQDFM